MSIYTVHMKETSDQPSAFERAVFVRDGFGWWALFLGPLWLLWNRAWLGFVIWSLIHIALGLLVHSHIIHMGAQGLLELLLAIALGFEAASIRRYVLRRRGFRLVDVVQNRRLADAERRFFARFEMDNPAPVMRTSATSGSSPLVGLFPSAGA